jgi:hypothetical protein
MDRRDCSPVHGSTSSNRELATVSSGHGTCVDVTTPRGEGWGHMRGFYQAVATVLVVLACALQSGCMTVGYSYAKDPKLVAKWEVTITKIEPQNIYNAAGVFWVGPFAKVESRGQRISLLDQHGKSVEIVQPLSDRYELHIGQKALYVADRGQVWVQPVDYPLPPEFGSPGVASTAPSFVPYESSVTIDLPRGWDKKPVTDQMKAGGTLVYAINQTMDSGLKLSALKRETVTDTMAFASSRQAALASGLKDAMRSDISKTDTNGRTTYRFEVSGTPIAGGIHLTYSGAIIEGSKEIAYVVSWTSAAGFEKQRSSLMELAGIVSGF